MSVLAARPLYIHSAKQDTDSFLIETTDHEIWVVWRGTQVMFYFINSDRVYIAFHHILGEWNTY